jgi:chlorite dismutase
MSHDAKRPNPEERPHGGHGAHAVPSVDVRERGLPVNGQPQFLDRRLFMQLLVFRAPGIRGAAQAIGTLADALAAESIAGVVYEDVNDPQGLALLTWSEDPAHFTRRVRPLFARDGLAELVFRPEMTMLGRTYSTGFETDLDFWLLRRPVETALHEGWDFVVWYPLRRTGAYYQLSREEQGAILREHGMIGRAYGEQDLAHDIRLACHGMDVDDNEFVVGLLGKELYPLSHVVQSMRSTKQTSQYMQKMGPFFVGHAARRSTGR